MLQQADTTEVKYNFHPLLTNSPMKMEQTECSETLEFKLQTQGYHPEERIRQHFTFFKFSKQ
jgi:hypothetical protein